MRWLTALGLCDGTPAWWAVWVDVLTQAPRFKFTDCDRTEEFTTARGLDRDEVLEALSQTWLTTTPALDAVTGPMRRWPYRYEGDGPTPTDSCQYGGGRCDGSCKLSR